MTPGQQHEATQVPALLQQGGIRRANGRLRTRPERVAGDKGYTGRRIRRYLRRRGIKAVIPRLRTEPRRGVRFDTQAYRARNAIERLIGRLKQHRAIATRYDKLACRYGAMLTSACIFQWI